jgi:hypothetical protein
MTQLATSYKVFALNSGLVVARAIFMHEDNGHHYDPSHFEKPFPEGMFV